MSHRNKNCKMLGWIYKIVKIVLWEWYVEWQTKINPSKLLWKYFIQMCLSQMHLGKFKKNDANKKILLHTRYPIAWIHISVTNCIKHFISLSFHTKILVLAKKLHIVGNTVCKCICIAWCIIRIKKKSFLHVLSNVSLRFFPILICSVNRISFFFVC